MKLLYVLGSYYPAQSGGPNNTIHWQAKYLSKNGLEVTVASLKSGLTKDGVENYNIKLNTENDVEGVKAYYFDYLKNRYLSYKFYIWMILNLKRFEFVQLTSYFFPVTWFAAFLCNIYKIPFSLAPRGELETNALKYSGSVKKFFSKTLLTFLYKKARFILITSDQEREFSEKYFHHDMRFEHIPNYIDLSSNIKLTDDEVDNKKNILYLGRIHPKKGIENLIKAYFKLSHELTDRHSLLIAGSGDLKYERELKALAYCDERYKDKIFFLGHKQGAEKEKLYKECKVFVLPSYSENFGNVVLESLSFSTPVISSKFAPWEELDKEECGFWVENSPCEIMNKLETILRMSALDYRKYSTNSFYFVYEKYDSSQNIGSLIATYSSYSKKE